MTRRNLSLARILCSVLIFVFLFSGCSPSSPTKDEGKIKIICTIFPVYDWMSQILGERANDVELTLLVDHGVDFHSYQPTVDDMIRISNCDMFIHLGGESSQWVEDALKEVTNKDQMVINLLEVLGDHAKDEHLWLSLKNAKILCTKMAEALGAIDPDNAELYRSNVDSYIRQLDALDMNYSKTIDNAMFHTLLFGDRFPFLYLAEDYGLEYYAPFMGCSAETEVSFQTIASLADKVDKLGLSSILTLEDSDQKIAKTIKENTAEKNQRILSLDSMQSIVQKDVEEGATYLRIMEKNLEVLNEALNE